MPGLALYVCILYMQTQNRKQDHFGCEARKLFYDLIAHNEHSKCWKMRGKVLSNNIVLYYLRILSS